MGYYIFCSIEFVCCRFLGVVVDEYGRDKMVKKGQFLVVFLKVEFLKNSYFIWKLD